MPSSRVVGPLVTELAVFPLIAIWLAAANLLMACGVWGRKGGTDRTPYNIRAVFSRAATDQPALLLGIGLVYALDSVFYFYAQSNLGAVTYTVLAQTKIFFTVAALRMRGMLGSAAGAQVYGAPQGRPMAGR